MDTIRRYCTDPHEGASLSPSGWDLALLDDAAARARRYLEALPTRRVAADPQAVARLAARVGEPVPETPRPAAQVLAELDAWGSPATVATAGPRYFGFVTGGALPATVAAGWLAAAWDQNAFSRVSSPAGAHLEAIALGWLRALLGLPDTAAGAVVTGATLANFTALAAARHALYARVGWDVDARGLRGAPPLRVVVSEETHPTVHKGLGLLGLGREPDVVLPTDGQGRIRADALPRLRAEDGPVLLCAQAGNVNSGASDPFPALRAWCDEMGGWLHVDGAFGLWAAASPAHRAQVAGVEAADSWATDAHKWLNVPYDAGVALVRDADALRRAMAMTAAYFPDPDGGRDPYDFGPEASRRARGVELWAAIRALGREGVAALVARCCAHAQRFAEGLRAAGHEVLNEVVLNQVVVSFGDARRCAAVAARVEEEGVCWLGPTRWKGRDALRISVSSWATGEDDVERSLAALRRAAEAEGAGPGAG